VLLTRAEMDGILITVKEAAAKGKKLFAGTGAESTAETIERTKRAAELGYDAALVKTPYYYKPAYSPKCLSHIFRRVADEFSNSGDALFHSAVHRRGACGRGRRRACRASQYYRHQR